MVKQGEELAEIREHWAEELKEFREQQALAEARAQKKRVVERNTKEFFALFYRKAPASEVMTVWRQHVNDGYVDFDVEAVDGRGMTFLHHAVREGYETILQDLMQERPHLANITTHACSKPNCWTPLQCLADKPKNFRYIEQHASMAWYLAEHMTQEAVFNMTGNGTCVFHQLTSHGHNRTLEVLLPFVQKRS